MFRPEVRADGVAVVEMLMALYKSAETGQTIDIASTNLESFVSAVAQ